MLKVHEITTASGDLAGVFLCAEPRGLALVREGESLPLPDGALAAVMTRYGKALDDASAVTRVATLDLGGGRALHHVRHLARYDVIALDFLVYEAPGSESLCAHATTVAGALEHLARAAAAAARDGSAGGNRARAVAGIPSGLCEHCRHCKTIASARGSIFRLCLLHETDPRFAKYPRVPVMRCPGYAAKCEGEGEGR